MGLFQRGDRNRHRTGQAAVVVQVPLLERTRIPQFFGDRPAEPVDAQIEVVQVRQIAQLGRDAAGKSILAEINSEQRIQCSQLRRNTASELVIGYQYLIQQRRRRGPQHCANISSKSIGLQLQDVEIDERCDRRENTAQLIITKTE